MTTVILKPTDACNARCRYCSAAHQAGAKVMSAESLQAVFRLFGEWASRYGRNRLHFIWHGGEPLLMPASFWEEVLAGEDQLRKRGITVGNGIQTNATRISPESIPVLKRLLGLEGVVGTSMDPIPGIRELHGGPEGLYQTRWDEAIRLLEGAGIRYGLVYVVHRLALPRLVEGYQQLRGRHPGAGIRFNPLYRQGRADEPEVWGDLGITAEQWGAALSALHGAWVDDGRPARILPFGPWWQLHEEGRWHLSCECSGRCYASHFGVNPDGAVHLCGRSADGGSFPFGQAAELTAEALHHHPHRQLLANRGVYLKRTSCRGCPWWLYCHGGCVNDGLLEHGTPFAPTSFCPGLRDFFDRTFDPASTVGAA